ncbi:MAG: phosphoribosylformylglycinamidine synthase subunit PurS [Desulfurococcaceae archaeon]
MKALVLYNVGVVVRYKRELRDPESEVIYKDLILRKGYKSVKKLEVGKFFNMWIEAGSPEEAINTVKHMCKELRLYNPVVQEIEVMLRGESSSS